MGGRGRRENERGGEPEREEGDGRRTTEGWREVEGRRNRETADERLGERLMKGGRR